MKRIREERKGGGDRIEDRREEETKERRVDRIEKRRERRREDRRGDKDSQREFDNDSCFGLLLPDMVCVCTFPFLPAVASRWAARHNHSETIWDI